MRDDLTGLTTLLAVARHGSFTAAAVALAVTPSAVSQTIKNLEQHVGVRLLQRTTRRVALTEAGARFVAQLEPAVASVRGAYESLAELRDRPAGMLRLSVSKLAYDLVVGPKLPAFLAAYPDISVELGIDDAFRDLVADGFDAGIRLGESVERDMIGVRLGGELRMAIVGSPAYFAAHGRPTRPRDLQAHACICYRQRSSGAVYRWELARRGREFEIAVTGRVVVDDGDVMLGAALAGMGLAYVIEPAARPHVAAKRLQTVLESYLAPFPGFFLYYPSRRHLAPKLAALVDFYKPVSAGRVVSLRA